jgi:hypothetical protein
VAAAEINMKILGEGTVKWETGRIPGEHHDDADAMLKELEELLGGDIEKKLKAARPTHVHTNDHGHVHLHDGHPHSHD